MSYAPGAPPCIWALRIDPGTKLTLLCSWSRADHQDQKNPKPCTIWFPRRFYPADHPKAGKAMPPASARDLDVAERTGSTPSAVRKHFTKLRALGLADASGRCVELTPPSQDCPHRGTDCDDTTNPSVASTAPTGARTATLGAKAATTGSAQLNPPVPPTPPSPAVEARDPHDLDQYGIPAPTAEERCAVYGPRPHPDDVWLMRDKSLDPAPTPPNQPDSPRRQAVTPKPSSVVPPVDPWPARVREASEGAYVHLEAGSRAYESSMREARADYGDAGVLELLRKWEGASFASRPPAYQVWFSDWRPWVRGQLGITAPKPEARQQAGHFPMRGSLPDLSVVS